VVAEFELTKGNRLRLARAFRHCPRVDLSIDCVVEGQMGSAFVDDPREPTAFRVSQGSFYYFAGEARSVAGREMMGSLLPSALLMPSPPEWIEVAKEVYGAGLQELGRYSFSSVGLSLQHLERLLSQSRFRDAIRPIDGTLAAQFRGEKEGLIDLSMFDSAADFVARGVGFYLPAEGNVAAAAYSSLVCSKGIEVSIFVRPEYRQCGLATALGCRLAIHCLERGLEPHWDAANLESCRLAERLGYRRSGTYLAYYREE